MQLLSFFLNNSEQNRNSADARELRLILDSMDQALCASQAKAIALIADRKLLEEHLLELRETEAEWTAKAASLLAEGRNDIAHEALVASERLNGKIAQLEAEIVLLIEAQDKIERELTTLSDTHDDLQTAEARARRRLDVALSQVDIRQALQTRDLHRASIHLEGANAEARDVEARAEVLAITAVRRT